MCRSSLQECSAGLKHGPPSLARPEPLISLHVQQGNARQELMRCLWSLKLCTQSHVYVSNSTTYSDLKSTSQTLSSR